MQREYASGIRHACMCVRDLEKRGGREEGREGGREGGREREKERKEGGRRERV